MKLTFYGATHEVTGSCTLIEVGDKHILVDCGMEQGGDIFENQVISVDPSMIDCVLLTHAHIDHSGNIPLLYKNGFRGSVYSTNETRDLSDIMLRDSAHIQMLEAEWKNRKAKRSDDNLIMPLYDLDDAANAISKFIPFNYNEKKQILENVQIRFTDIGHLLGSASIEVWLTEDNITRKIVFSGDIGNSKQPLLNDPQPTLDADYVVVESTYGDRYHEKTKDYVESFTEYIQKAFDRGGNVIIPSFAVGRTQEMLYFIRQIKQQGLIHGHKNFKVFVDSPLAINATGIFMQCDSDCFDEETQALLRQNINPLYFDNLCISTTTEDSKAINNDPEPKIIISASGMCEAGRIRHHLKHNLWKEESLVLFVGYQANGTLGRALLDGAKKVKLFGEEISVHSEIGLLQGVSGHADKQGLIDWLGNFTEKPQTIFVNHGEDLQCTAFTKCLNDEYGYNATAPYSGSVFDLIENKYILETDGVYIRKAAKSVNPNSPYGNLLSSAEKLLETAKRFEELPNKDIRKFEKDIAKINEIWSRWIEN